MQTELYACTEIASMTYQSNIMTMKFDTLSLLHMILLVILALSIDFKQSGFDSSKEFQKATQYYYMLVMLLIFLFVAFFHPSETGSNDLVENIALCFSQEREDRRQFTSTMYFVFIYFVAILGMCTWSFVSYQRLVHQKWTISAE